MTTRQSLNERICKSLIIRRRWIITTVLIIHAAMLAWSSAWQSIVVDETGHLPAGLAHWSFMRFDLYAVNPPLVRTVAAIPVIFRGYNEDWSAYSPRIGNRSEFALGVDLVSANPESFMTLWRIARWACMPLSLLGAIVCYRWANELYGTVAGLIALLLWCISPNVLANASLITPDAGAASIGLAACYLFWRWQRAPSWPAALAAGIVLGLAELTKFTWVLLYPMLPMAWLIRKGAFRLGGEVSDWKRDIRQLIVLLLVSLYVINLGYLFEGSFTKLGNFEFSSKALSGLETRDEMGKTGNRFHDTWLHSIPIPLPKNYLMGIDHIKFEYENKYWSYLRGEYRRGGWWYYYLYAMLVKIPVGTLGLLVLSVAVAVTSTRGWAHVYDQLFVLTPAVLVIVLVSSQTGFNHHLRYVLPAFPFLFIFASQAAILLCSQHRLVRGLPLLCLMATMISSLSVYPHSGSYFNILVGGPINGWRHLGFSNIDWGQDLLRLKMWQESHPEAMPLHVDCAGRVAPSYYRIESISARARRSRDGHWTETREFEAGWYALGVHRMLQHNSDLQVFLKQEPVERIGFSIHIYYLLKPLPVGD